MIALAFSTNSGLVLSSPIVGYRTPDMTQLTGLSESENENDESRTARMTSVQDQSVIWILISEINAKSPRTHLQLRELESAVRQVCQLSVDEIACLLRRTCMSGYQQQRSSYRSGRRISSATHYDRFGADSQVGIDTGDTRFF